MKKGNAAYSFNENLYIWISKAVCGALSDTLRTTEDDVLELKNTASVLHIDGDIVTWNPIDRFIVPVTDIVVKIYLIQESPKRHNISANATTESANDLDDNLFSWSSSNETIVKLDKGKHKWVPVDEFLVRYRQDDSTIEWHPVNESKLYIDDKMEKLLPLDTIRTPLKDNMINWYSTKKPQNKLNNTIKWYPSLIHLKDKIKLNESYMDPEDSFVYMVNKEDVRKNWYLVNETHVAIKQPDINITRETKIIIHGFLASPADEVTKHIAMAYHKQNIFNVLLINVEVMFKKIYFKCVKNARLVGKAIAELIIHLVSFGIKAADFHLIGVSLGAHAAGWAGKYYLHSEGRHLGRITGLDPAGPCFANLPRDKRLDKTDALHVDVIHSNSLLEGLFEPLGHADFFLNGGGPFQPGCFGIVCNHLTAAYVYTESISRPELFVAVKCDSWAQFQDNQCSNETTNLGAPLPDTRGVYYLRTSGERPYGLGIDGIRSNKL
ncbi:hypothetical protein O0L34_g8353 [Tuta absoluta]|nr:hypothetical protein O0L34_g8353 [Tuta absoluta]